MDPAMEDDKPPPYVQYRSSDATVTLVEAGQVLPQASPKILQRHRCASVKCLAVALAVCLITTLAALAVLLHQRFELSPKAEHFKSTVAFDITNLRLWAAHNRYVTVTWDRPEGRFDFYLLDATVRSGNRTNTGRKPYSGFCANGTIFPSEKSQVTCGPFDACSSISVTVRTFNKGPPEHISIGATLKDVFIGGQDPSEPRSINIVARTPRTTRVLWEPPRNVDGILDGYKVKVCKKSKPCDGNEKFTGCVEHEVSDAWLDISSTADTSYCVFVSASARCGGSVLTGIPAAQEIRTPLFALPDVNNLSLVAADNHYITMAWDQPPVNFDFYRLEVTNENGSLEKRRANTCGNGTIILPEQTHVTCGPFDVCSTFNVTVRTYSKGPPELLSIGATLHDIFIDGKEPTEPRNIVMLPKSASTTTLQWEAPTILQGTLDVYKVKVCEAFMTCNEKQNLSGCLEYETSDAWLDISSSPDTQYCIVITARARCGRNLYTSLPGFQEIVTPLFALPDVSNLALAGVKNGYVTLSWQRPKGRFDYYSVEVTEHTASSAKAAQKRQGLCANGTIIHSDQKELTCGPFEPCTHLSCTIRTHFNGPPEHRSPGVAVTGIFIPLEDPSPPTNVTMIPESSSRTRLHWSRPEKPFGVLESYTVKICNSTLGTCDSAETLSDCAEHATTETWTLFDSEVDTSYCVLITATTRCGNDHVSSPQVKAQIRTPLFELPDVTNLNLLAVDNHYITIIWERPRLSFDFYWLEVTGGNGNENDALRKRPAATCGNGTIIRPEQTQVTCGPFDTCSSVNVTVRTYSKGPPELVSMGTTLNEIFIDGQEPTEPRNVVMLPKSPSMTRLQWEVPATLHGTLDVYKVKVCEVFNACDQKQNLSGCAEYETSNCWLEVRTTPDTQYCVVVTARALCGGNFHTGRPATEEVRTTVFDLPDVSNLTSAGAQNGYITLSWKRPEGRFDYYSIEVIDGGSSISSQHKLGLCVNGTIIRPDQTKVTCGPYDQCTVLSYTLRTHLTGLLERSSPGVTVKDIFIPAEEPHPPRNITMVPTSQSRTELHWNYPYKVASPMLSYNVKICRSFRTCAQAENFSNCQEHLTSETRMTFDSAVNTAYCVLITAKARCGLDEISSQTAVAEIQTPIFVPPDVTNLRLLSVGANNFTAAWKKPEVNFDYYWIEVIGANDHGIEVTPGTVGSCVNGSIIHPEQTQVTCSQLPSCSKVNFKIRTHITGPPARTSSGVYLYGILITDAVPPVVSNLKLLADESDTFTLTWQRPKACFDYYTVEVDDSSGGRIGAECNNGTVISSRMTHIVCDQIPTCGNVTIRVITHTRGPPERSSAGAVLRSVLLQGKAPAAVTDMKLVAADGDRFTVSFRVPEGCFDYYSYGAYVRGSSTNVLRNKGCKFKSLGYSLRTLTCTGILTCGKVDLNVRVLRSGPPERFSRSVTLRSINIRAKC